MMHWLLLRSEKWSHVSWCTDFPLDLKRSSQMFHDALLNLFRSRRQGWKCVICHDALTSLEIWKMITCVMMHWLPIRSGKKFTDVSWCAPKSLQIQKTRLKMCHMSWCTDFSWDLKNDSGCASWCICELPIQIWMGSSQMFHDAHPKSFFRSQKTRLKMCHHVMMHWLLLRSEKWSSCDHDALTSH